MTHQSHNSTQDILLLLLRGALTGEVRSLPCSLVPWNELMELANEQGVLAIMYDGFCAYAKAGDVQMSLKEKTDLYGNVKIIERTYDVQMRILEKLSRLYSDHNIPTMVLKGYGLSMLYPVPNHRQCSDVDIYLFGHHAEADRLVEEKWGIKVSTEHHHHTEFVMDGVLVENHYDFINVHAHSSSPRIEKELKKIVKMEDGEVMLIGNERVFAMPPTLGALFLIRHTAQHFAAKHVELRHLIDWLLFTKAYKHNIDWSLVNRVAMENGFKRFMDAFDRLSYSLIEDTTLNDIEKQIMDDIWNPRFRDDGPTQGFFKIWSFKARRWWGNRWKNRLVYKESLLDQVWTLLKSRFVKTM